jgi:hypothetical protein
MREQEFGLSPSQLMQVQTEQLAELERLRYELRLARQELFELKEWKFKFQNLSDKDGWWDKLQRQK